MQNNNTYHLSYRDYVFRSVQFLVFWGKFDYQSVLRMSVSRRKMFVELTQESLKQLFPKPKGS